MEEHKNGIEQDEQPYKKPPRHIQIFLIFYGFFLAEHDFCHRSEQSLYWSY